MRQNSHTVIIIMLQWIVQVKCKSSSHSDWIHFKQVQYIQWTFVSCNKIRPNTKPLDGVKNEIVRPPLKRMYC